MARTAKTAAQKKTSDMTAQELYQIAKRNEIINRLKKERDAKAAREAFDHFADVMQAWTGNRQAPSYDQDGPLTETITLPEAYREPVPRTAFGTPIRQVS